MQTPIPQSPIFGGASDRVSRAVAAIASGGGVLVVDDENRENEGDLIFGATTLTTEQMARMICHGSGIVCLILTEDAADALELAPMVEDNTSRNATAFTVSIEAKEGVTTGVSAADRVHTIRVATAVGAKPADLARPGHVFPLRAHPGGLNARRGHTEATIELLRRAQRPQSGVLCELMNPDGTMMRGPALVRYAMKYNFPMITIEDLVATVTSAPESQG